MKKTLLIICFAFLVGGCNAQNQENIDHLKTFAKAYGYIKYFHPSDEASEIDWNSFATLGAEEILKSNNSQEVVATLNNLFKPMAPGVVFSNTKQKYDFAAITPKSKKGYQPSYWQHKGVSKDMSFQGEPYKSVRVNRYTEIDESSGFGNLTVAIDAEKYIGKEIKYTGWVKLKEDSKGTGHLWMRVDLEDKTLGFFENMNNNPIRGNTWEQYEIIGTVDDNAVKLNVGSFLMGRGTLFLDDVHLYYKENDEWIEIPINNSDFEADKIGVKNEQSAWIGTSEGYTYDVSNTEQREGDRCAVIAHNGKIKLLKEKPLFDAAPQFGKLIEKEIGNGIYCYIPISIYGNKDHTYPKSENLAELQNKLRNVNQSLSNRAVYLGNVINTYNVFQHFYPYFNEVDVDWNKELETALQRSLNDKTEYDHLVTLQKFTAPLKDGHIYISGIKTGKYVPPINWEWIEENLVITKIKEAGLNIEVGDVVTRVNNQSSDNYFKEIYSRISAGTEGWLNYRAQSTSLLGEKDEPLTVTINNQEIVLKRNRLYDYSEKDIAIQEHEYTVLNDNIYYLNLSTVEMDTIIALLPKLQKAKGIICDLRGYPNGNHSFISHLLKKKDTSKAWMRVPEILYPDQENIVGFDSEGWEIPAQKPYLGDKKVVFIIDGRAISYAESYMSFIEGYQLATIVGQPTAGTNGNINPFTISGGISISWTGMKVVKHDGSELHGVGILPDIYVNKTIEGVRLGKDEFLEKALEVILK